MRSCTVKEQVGQHATRRAGMQAPGHTKPAPTRHGLFFVGAALGRKFSPDCKNSVNRPAAPGPAPGKFPAGRNLIRKTQFTEGNQENEVR